MQLTGINVPVRIGRATVLPGDLVLAKTDGVIFIPASLAEEAISRAEFTNLQDQYNFELNRAGANGAEFEGGWRSEEHTSELQSLRHLVCRLLLEKKKTY